MVIYRTGKFQSFAFLATIERASLAFSQEDKSVSLKWSENSWESTYCLVSHSRIPGSRSNEQAWISTGIHEGSRRHSGPSLHDMHRNHTWPKVSSYRPNIQSARGLMEIISVLARYRHIINKRVYTNQTHPWWPWQQVVYMEYPLPPFPCASQEGWSQTNQSIRTYSTWSCTKKWVTFACPVLGYRHRVFFFLLVLLWFGHVFSNQGRFGHKWKVPVFFLLPRNWFQARPIDIMNQTKTQKFEKFLRSGTSFDTHLAYHHVQSVTGSSTVPSDYAFVISHVVCGWTDTAHPAWWEWQFGRFACFLLAACLKAAEMHQIGRSITKWTSDTKGKSRNVILPGNVHNQVGDGCLNRTILIIEKNV